MYLKISQGKTCVEVNESGKLYIMKNLWMHKKENDGENCSINYNKDWHHYYIYSNAWDTDFKKN